MAPTSYEPENQSIPRSTQSINQLFADIRLQTANLSKKHDMLEARMNEENHRIRSVHRNRLMDLVTPEQIPEVMRDRFDVYGTENRHYFDHLKHPSSHWMGRRYYNDRGDSSEPCKTREGVLEGGTYHKGNNHTIG